MRWKEGRTPLHATGMSINEDRGWNPPFSAAIATPYLLFPSAHRLVLRTSLTPSLLSSLSPPLPPSSLRTLANLGLREAAGPTGLLLLVESDAPAPPAARVRFGVTLTERRCTFCLRNTMEYVCRRGGSKKGRGQRGGLASCKEVVQEARGNKRQASA